MAHIGIIGAGIAGLTAAYRLQETGHTVTVIEAADRIGGMIQSERADGFLIEHGPNSLRPDAPILSQMIDDLGLSGACVSANAAAQTRYVVRDGRPHALPLSPGAFLTTPLLSATAKLRLLAEPFIPAGDAPEENVAGFVRRRLGPEILDYAVNPFVGGIFAGDPERLSLKHAFEKLHTMEHDHGSLFRAMLHAMRTRSKDTASDAPSAAPDGLFSFREGIHTLPRTLADALDRPVRTQAPVTALRPTDGGWRLTSVPADDAPHIHGVDAVISTVPLHQIKTLDLPTEQDVSVFDTVPYPPVSVLALGYDRTDVAHPLDGFGMLVPEREDEFRILGTLFSSTLFPGRAPEGQVLLTTFVGGMRAPDLGDASPERLQTVVRRDLRDLLGVRGTPTFVRPVRWPRAIPQYRVGYGTITATLDRLEAAHPGLFFAGNYRSGISVGDTMASGADAADAVTAYVEAPASVAV